MRARPDDVGELGRALEAFGFGSGCLFRHAGVADPGDALGTADVGEQVLAVGLLVPPVVVDRTDAAAAGATRHVGGFDLAEDVADRLLAEQLGPCFQQLDACLFRRLASGLSISVRHLAPR